MNAIPSRLTDSAELTTLVRDAGRVVTHRQLLEAVWGAHSAADTHHVRVYMAQLRHKLERDSARPKLLKSNAFPPARR